MKFGHCAAWSFGKIPHGNTNLSFMNTCYLYRRKGSY